MRLECAAHRVLSMSDGVGSAVRALRLIQERTLEDLAAAAGIHRNTLISIEQGRADTTVSTACALAGALGYDVVLLPAGLEISQAVYVCHDDPEPVGAA